MRKPRKPQTKTLERNLHFDLGHGNDSKYYTASSLVNKSSPLFPITWLNDDWCLSQYYFGERNRTTPVSPVCAIMGRETITSTSGRRSFFNNCVHRKTQAKTLPYLMLFDQFNNSSLGYALYYWRNALTTPINTSIGNLADFYGCGQVGNDQMFSSRAYWSMRPKFAGDVSIVNSLFELKDFKDVFNLSKQALMLSKAAKLLREHSFYKAPEKSGSAKLKEINAGLNLRGIVRDGTGTAANAWLTYALAVMPTIKDYLAITAQLCTDVHEKQKTFRDYGVDGTTSHFSEVEVIDRTQRGTNNHYVRATGTHISVKRTATARWKYDYLMRDSNEALRKYWGLTGTAEQLWNMLPMSFVMDYFLQVGKSLSYMDWDENVTNLKAEYCESLKVTATSGHSIVQSPRVQALIIDGKYIKPIKSERLHLVTGYCSTFYERKVMDPVKGVAFPKIKGPSSKQAGTLLALARGLLS